MKIKIKIELSIGKFTWLLEKATVVHWSLFSNGKPILQYLCRSARSATIALLQPFKGAVFTITADNGKEFQYHEVMTEYLKCGVYFADPYCSWQHGLNKNTNGLLRQYFPKSTDFKKVSQSALENVTVRLNERARKKLNDKTPAKLMAEYVVAIAA